MKSLIASRPQRPEVSAGTLPLVTLLTEVQGNSKKILACQPLEIY